MSEVAHDHQVQVKKYVREELHLKNSSDTWHGRVVCVCACVCCDSVHVCMHNTMQMQGQRELPKP